MAWLAVIVLALTGNPGIALMVALLILILG